jgi:hypothetical protein
MFSSTCHRAYLNSYVSHTLQLLQVRQWDVECIACRGLGLQHQLENWLLVEHVGCFDSHKVFVAAAEICTKCKFPA